MTAYPYNTSIENYPYDEEHNQYLSEWNTRICNDRSDSTCYNSTTGEQIIGGLEINKKFLSSYSINNENQSVKSENVSDEPLPRSLNTNYVEVTARIVGHANFNYTLPDSPPGKYTVTASVSKIGNAGTIPQALNLTDSILIHRPISRFTALQKTSRSAVTRTTEATMQTQM